MPQPSNNTCLERKILFHGAVIVEVVAGQVGEDGDVEWNPINPLLLQRVRGNFHHGLGRALAQGLVQNAIQFQRFRSGVRRRQNFSGNVIFDGPDQRALAARGGKNGFEQECGRTFPVRAGDAGDGQPLGRLLVEVGAEPRQRPASVRHLGPGYIRTGPFGRGVGNDRDRSCRDRLVDEFVPITRFAPHGDKGIARLDPARVILQAADTGVAALRKHFRTVQEFEESHCFGF